CIRVRNVTGVQTCALPISTSGADADWSFIKKESLPYVNTEYVFQLPEETTGSYTAVLDETGEMVVGFADMDVYDKLTPETIHERSAILSQAKCLVADLNCPKDTLDTLEDFANNHDIPLALITVSGPKMKRMPDNLSGERKSVVQGKRVLPGCTHDHK